MSSAFAVVYLLLRNDKNTIQQILCSKAVTSTESVLNPNFYKLRRGAYFVGALMDYLWKLISIWVLTSTVSLSEKTSVTPVS